MSFREDTCRLHVMARLLYRMSCLSVCMSCHVSAFASHAMSLASHVMPFASHFKSHRSPPTSCLQPWVSFIKQDATLNRPEFAPRWIIFVDAKISGKSMDYIEKPFQHIWNQRLVALQSVLIRTLVNIQTIIWESGYSENCHDTLSHLTATHCNTLQHTATHCNILQHTATYCDTLQHTATCCNTLRHIATYWNTLQLTATCCNTLRHVAIHCNMLQYTATCC